MVSKVFDNSDLSFHKITVECHLRLNFQASQERIARLEDESGFKNLATSNKKGDATRLKEIEGGERRQEELRGLLQAFTAAKGDRLYQDRAAFLFDLKEIERQGGVRLSAAESKAVLGALSERDTSAEICRDKHGQPEPDAELRDTENVPLSEGIAANFRREVLPLRPPWPPVESACYFTTAAYQTTARADRDRTDHHPKRLGPGTAKP